MPLFDYACMTRAYKIACVTFPISLVIYAAVLASDPATDKRDLMRFATYFMTCMLLYMMPPVEVGAPALRAARGGVPDGDGRGQREPEQRLDFQRRH